MLVAQLEGQRIEANMAEKGHDYRCPKCQESVILKKGRIKLHHFAHKPPFSCNWGKGETEAHRNAKNLFKEEFCSRQLKAEVEYEIHALTGDRRADVVVWSPQGQRFAIELQHTGIDYDNLEHRTRSYIQAGVPVIWLPFLNKNIWDAAEPLGATEDGDYWVERFAARPLERWVHSFYYGKPWMYDPVNKSLWRYKLKEHKFYVKTSSWYEDGKVRRRGGYWKTAKRWRELTLWGPYHLSQIGLGFMKRIEIKFGNYQYPSGIVGEIILLEEQK